MCIFSISGISAETFILWGAAVSFCLFAAYVLAARLAAANDCYAKLNRAHTLFFIPYLAAALLFAFKAGELNLALLPALAAGCFIYFSLHYVYLFALVGLAKLSISVNLLSDITGLGRSAAAGVEIPAFMAYEKEKFALIRADRLAQMVTLNMAREIGGTYTITKHGRRLNRLGQLILKIWNLRRL